MSLVLVFLLSTPFARAVQIGCEPLILHDEKQLDLTNGRADEFKAAEAYVLRALDGLSVWDGAEWTKLLGDRAQEVVDIYSLAIGLRIHGMDDSADARIGQLAERLAALTGKAVRTSELLGEIHAIADRPEIERPFARAHRLVNNQLTVEEVMLQATASYPEPLIAGPQQIEMARLIDQYAFAADGDSMLVLGAGAPAISIGIKAYSRAAFVGGLDTYLTPGTGARAWLQQRRIYIEGSPLGETVLAELAKTGSHRVVAALDLMAADPQFRRIFTATPATFLPTFKRMLDPGGVLLILNDFGSEPNFTRQDAEAAGFTIVRWGLDRTLTDAAVAAIPYFPDARRAGQMRAFVLQNGPGRQMSSAEAVSRDVEY